jgi:hypothetical protein
VIADIDKVLRKLITREINIKDNEVDITFDQPKREWSSRLSKPTLNLFLFDIRENLRLRGSEQFKTVPLKDGTSEVRRNPIRVDLRYLLTSWVKDAEDEHFLLSSAMLGLLRNPFLPEDILPERLQNQPAPIAIEVATFPPEIGPVDKFTEIWGVLDNELRPGILVTVTICMDPYKPEIFSQVRTTETRILQDTGFAGVKDSISTKSPSKTYWSAGGTIKSEKYDTSALALILVEKQLPIEIGEEGRFALKKITEGDYHLDILYNKKVLKRQKIHIPSPDYEIQV